MFHLGTFEQLFGRAFSIRKENTLDNDNKTEEVAPVVNRATDEETTDANTEPSFSEVISEQAKTIAEQQRQIADLLAAVGNLTKAGANYQQGERPTAPAPGQNPVREAHEKAKTIEEMDFRI